MRRTRTSIMAAFAQLLEERPMNKITVKDIVDRCDINRNTFYYHFPDIPSLLQEMMEEKVNTLIETHCTLGRPLDCIKPALQYGMAHKQAVLHVYRAVPRESFLIYMNRLAQHMVDEYFDTISKAVSIPAEDAEILNRYYKCMVVGCLLDWLDAAMRYDLEANMERICFLMEGAGEHAIQKAVEQAAKG
jgi:AcrR family transcriptional regulator